MPPGCWSSVHRYPHLKDCHVSPHKTQHCACRAWFPAHKAERATYANLSRLLSEAHKQNIIGTYSIVNDTD